MNDDRGLLDGLIGDGRPLLLLLGVGLILSGLFGLFLGISGQFLPHDEQFLGMTAKELCSHHGCRVVHFMVHDRVAFGGALVAIGILYLWLAEFPLKQRQGWAWWLFLLTGTLGFGTFFSYLAYGYFDTWHGVASLGLLPCFILGLVRSHSLLDGERGIRSLLRPSVPLSWSASGFGRACLLATSAGLIGGGLVIFVVGMTAVFVPQDLTFMGVSVEELNALNPRLMPLIAHDRAGFGGAVFVGGLTLFFCVWCGTPSRSLWQSLALAGAMGFSTAIGVHPAVGYNDAVHLAPPVVGAVGFLLGLLFTFNAHRRTTSSPRQSQPRVPNSCEARFKPFSARCKSFAD